MYSKILCASAIALCSTAAIASESKWTPTFELEGRVNDDRSLASPKFLIPIMQDETSMFFTDIRTRIDDNNSEEYNVGLGYRQMKGGWIYGGYVFADYLSSANNFGYWQGTAGVEMLSEIWDLRINGYLPETEVNSLGGGGGGGLIIDGGGNFGIAGGGTSERALPGVDAEVGYKLPIDQIDLRVFGGAYYFDAEDFESVAGPKARVELTLNEDNTNFIGNGIEFTLGAQYQNDDERENTLTALAQFRVPFGQAENRSKLTPLEKRMTNFIERDVDIVTGSGESGGGTTEAATVEINGQSFTKADLIVNAGTANIAGDILGAGNSSLVIFDGVLGEIDSAIDYIEPRDGQYLIGAGTMVNVTGNSSGRIFTDAIPGVRPAVTSLTTGVFVLDSEQDVVIKGIDINARDAGILLTGGDTFNVLIDDVNIVGRGGPSTNDGIEISLAASDITIQNSTITDAGVHGIEIRNNSTGITLDNITLSDIGNHGISITSNVNADVTSTDITISNTTGSGVNTNSSNNIDLDGFTISSTSADAVVINNVDNSSFNNFTFNINGVDGFDIDDSDGLTINTPAFTAPGGYLYDLNNVTNSTGSGGSLAALGFCRAATGTNTGTSFTMAGGIVHCP